LQEFGAQITTFTNIYPPEFPESSYKIKLPVPLPAGYTIVGECGKVIEVTDYDYQSQQYRSDITFSLKDTTEDLEVTALKRDGRNWAVILKTTNTFRIEEPLTVTLVADVSIFCRLFFSKYTPTETPFKEMFIYNTSTIHVLILLPHVLFRE
jgi:predicted ribosome quality control (RQC) complex YloA/Tae2 family protein